MKRLIICCDGTWNAADQQHDGELCPTNVVRLANQIAKRDGPVPQIVFYDQGVGTGNVLDRVIGGAFGHGLKDNIFDAYRFLIANFEPGDEIFLFGFSRGAFTARSIAGMIRKCGILDRMHARSYPDALRLYCDAFVHPSDAVAVAFRRQYSCCGDDPIPIRCVGVWDTVGALGIPFGVLRTLMHRKYLFHDTELSGIVQFAFHALAIDEHRGPFEPTLWLDMPKPFQIVSQTWFVGAHSDIGGGYKERELSDISLEWMISNAEMAGLVFDKRLAIQPQPNQMAGFVHNSRKGVYRIMKRINRRIGTDYSQKIHPSVIARWDSDPKYRPANLREYFNLIGDLRGRSP